MPTQLQEIERLIRDINDLEKDMGTGDEKKEEKKEENFDVIKNQIINEMRDTRVKITTKKSRSSEKQTRDDAKISSDIDKSLRDIELLIEKMDQVIQDQNSKRVNKLISKCENFDTWELGLYATEEKEPDGLRLVSWFYLVAEAKTFVDLAKSADHADIDDLCEMLDFKHPDDERLQRFYKALSEKKKAVHPEDFYVFRKECKLVTNRCQGMLLLYKQLDYLKYQYKPNRFRHNQKFGYRGVASGEGKKQGRAAATWEARKKEMSEKGQAYRPVPASEQEMAFLEKSSQWEIQFNEELEDVLQDLVKLGQITADVKQELVEQAELIDELEDRVEEVNIQIVEGTEKLQELLEKTGGATRWCPRLIAFVLLLCVVGFIFRNDF